MTDKTEATRRARNHKCDFPACTKPAKRHDIKTSWFRGDDVVVFACKEHRKSEHSRTLLATDKAKRQMT